MCWQRAGHVVFIASDSNETKKIKAETKKQEKLVASFKKPDCFVLSKDVCTMMPATIPKHPSRVEVHHISLGTLLWLA